MFTTDGLNMHLTTILRVDVTNQRDVGSTAAVNANMLNKFPADAMYAKGCKSATLSTNTACPNTYAYAVGQFLGKIHTCFATG